MHVLGSNELVEDVFNRNLCIGCGACVNLCSYYKNHRGKTARLFPCDLSHGRCYAYCPKAEVDLDEVREIVARSSELRRYEPAPSCSSREFLTVPTASTFRQDLAIFASAGRRKQRSPSQARAATTKFRCEPKGGSNSTACSSTKCHSTPAVPT